MPDEVNLISTFGAGAMRPGNGIAARNLAAPADGGSFKQLLLDSLSEVNRLRDESDTAINNLAAGRTDNVAEVLSAVRKADVAYSLLMEIKNKLLDAYQELNHLRM